MFNTDPVQPRDATNDDALLFTRSAKSGYLEGMSAMLKAGYRFSHADWIDALDDALYGGHKEVLFFVLKQLAAHGADIIPDTEWYKRVKDARLALLPYIEECEYYVAACKVREKLRHKGVFADEVQVPKYIGSLDAIKKYEFCKDRESDIVGDHSQRRRHRMEASAADQHSQRAPADGWQPVGDFAPARSN